MFSEAPWGVRRISDQSSLMFESPAVLHLPVTSGGYLGTEHLSGWLGWRRWLQGCLCGCQSSVGAATAVSQSQNYRAQHSEQCAEILIRTIWSLCFGLGGSKQQEGGLPHTGKSEFMLGNSHKWLLYIPVFNTFHGVIRKDTKGDITKAGLNLITNYNFIICHNNHLCIINSFFIPAKREKSVGTTC